MNKGINYLVKILALGMALTTTAAYADAPLNPSYLTARVVSVKSKAEQVYGLPSADGYVTQTGRQPVNYDQVSFVVEKCETYDHSDRELRRQLDPDYEVGREYVLNMHSGVVEPGDWFVGRTARWDSVDPRNLLEVNVLGETQVSFNSKTRMQRLVEASKRHSAGIASMERNGTIVLDLRKEEIDGTMTDYQERYPMSHPEYLNVLERLDGLRYGQLKAIPASPEGK